MNIESWTASLHAGLIQRTRPAPGDNAAGTANGDAKGNAPSGMTVQFRESAIMRARNVLNRSPELREAQMPERITPAERAAPVMRTPPPARAPETHGYGGWAFGRRYNLTVRISAALREMVLDARLRTGRTTQRILHDALVYYLERLDQDRTLR